MNKYDCYYYLHINGSLIPRNPFVVDSDPLYFESDFVRKFWRINNKEEYDIMMKECAKLTTQVAENSSGQSTIQNQQSKINNLLTCPNCEETWWVQSAIGQYSADEIKEVDFRFTIGAKNATVAYACMGCGYIHSKETANPTKKIVFITGKSAGYKRKAMIAVGVEPVEFDDMIDLGKFAFMTEEFYNNQDDVNSLFTEDIVKFVDAKDNATIFDKMDSAVTQHE